MYSYFSQTWGWRTCIPANWLSLPQAWLCLAIKIQLNRFFEFFFLLFLYIHHFVSRNTYKLLLLVTCGTLSFIPSSYYACVICDDKEWHELFSQWADISTKKTLSASKKRIKSNLILLWFHTLTQPIHVWVKILHTVLDVSTGNVHQPDSILILLLS